MASGVQLGSVTYNSSKFVFYLRWTSTESIANNNSTVVINTFWGNVSETKTVNTFDTSSKRKASITCGTETANISQRFNCNPWPTAPGDDTDTLPKSVKNSYLIQTATFTVPHNNDGTASVKVSARANGTASSYGPSNSTSSSGDCTIPEFTITLPTIARAADFTLSPMTLIDETVPLKITIDKKVSSYWYSLRWRLNDSGSWHNLNSGNRTQNAVTTIPFATIASRLGTATSADVTVSVRTYDAQTGGNQISSEKKKNATIQVGNVALSLYDDKHGVTGVGLMGPPVDRAGLFYKGDEYAPVTVTIGSTTYTILAKV